MAVADECRGFAGSDGGNSQWEKDWHLASVFIVTGASALGVFLPIVSQTVRGFGHKSLVPMFAVQMAQFFGSGVIVATAFIHLFPAAAEALANVCLGAFADKYGAWASLFAMAAAFTMHSAEWWLVEVWADRTLSGEYAGAAEEAGAEGARGEVLHQYPPLLPPLPQQQQLPVPILSPPVNPLVFGAASTRSQSVRTSQLAPGSGYYYAHQTAGAPSTYTSAYTGFALTRHGNYAALARSRRQLAMAGLQSSDSVARYLRSDPQFPVCITSALSGGTDAIRMQPHRALASARGAIQAKSTPELMHNPYSIANAVANSAAFTTTTTAGRRHRHHHHYYRGSRRNESRAVSLRPNSFTRGRSPSFKHNGSSSKNGSSKRSSNASSGLQRQREARRESARRGSVAGLGWSHRCLSMPRLPPTTLDAAMCESLLAEETTLPHIQRQKQQRSSINGPPARLQPVPEDAAARSTNNNNNTSSGDEDAGSVAAPFATATDTINPAKSPLSGSSSVDGGTQQRQQQQQKQPKRVSIPTPNAAPSSFVYRSVATGMARSHPHVLHYGLGGNGASGRSAGLIHGGHKFGSGAGAGGVAVAAPGFDSDSADSTAIHSTGSSGSSRSTRADGTGVSGAQARARKRQQLRHRYPVEVQRRALATYVLELGIALYSVLVGLALSSTTTMRGFFALLVAVCFHQMFEGLALGSSLAELYWVKTQLACELQMELSAATAAAAAAAGVVSNGHRHIDSCDGNSDDHNVDNNGTGMTRDAGFSTTGAASAAASAPAATTNGCLVPLAESHVCGTGNSGLANEFVSTENDLLASGASDDYAKSKSKSRRTLASMATSFAPEPWQINPDIEHAVVLPPSSPIRSSNRSSSSTSISVRPRYLMHRTDPDRFPGWWKAWLSAALFTATTPVGIIVGLALRSVYEPHSRYALLLNGILQSICTGVLVYAGLVTLLVGGFNSIQVRQLPRSMQFLLFLAVYAGAAAVAAVKIWK
ncbi:hypothetical protein EV177_008036 [Coemansia sp. RSA 1804]|nr:hypothetical protein EV177_008036 [Coemansia sp. RSA 1804]